MESRKVPKKEIEAGGQEGGEGKQTCIFVKGTDGHYIEMNKVLVAQTLFGSTGEDVLGRRVVIK
jgi:hypothetical protein